MNWKELSIGILFIGASLIAGSASAFASSDNHDRQAVSTDLVTHYLAIQMALADDSLIQVPEHSAALKDMALATLKESGHGDKQLGHGAAAAFASATDQLAKAKNLEEARRAFGELSDALVESGDVTTTGSLNVAYCPMAKRHWLQTGNEISNPYYGSQMLRCGEFVTQPPATSHQGD